MYELLFSLCIQYFHQSVECCSKSNCVKILNNCVELTGVHLNIRIVQSIPSHEMSMYICISFYVWVIIFHIDISIFFKSYISMYGIFSWTSQLFFSFYIYCFSYRLFSFHSILYFYSSFAHWNFLVTYSGMFFLKEVTVVVLC